MDSIFDTLLSLPLFRGASQERITEIAGNTRLHFLRYADGETAIHAGEPCTHIKFVISGAVRCTITNRNGRFVLSQRLEAPEVIAPEFLFGLHPIYPCDARAEGTVSLMQIAKHDYLRVLNTDPVFQLNYLNTISSTAQKGIDGLMSLTSGELPVRIAYWISTLTQPRARDVMLQCRQRDLYALFGVTRTSFTAALESMKAQGLISFTSDTIRILDLDALCALNA